MLNYFEDTLANVSLPEALLERGSKKFTLIENKGVKHELN